MYTVYLNYYNDENGQYVDEETVLYTVPITTENAIGNPIVKAEMGKAGAFEFDISPYHPLFNCWRQIRTMMRVEYDGTTIFRGRVLTIDSTLKGEKKIHCEGDLAFLLDSIQEATKKEDRPEITMLAYLQQLINGHNTQMGQVSDEQKFITLGEVPGQYSSLIADAQKIKGETKKFGSDNFETTMSALEALQKDYGGYFCTRYENGVCYLDWLEGYFLDQPSGDQPIEISENLISLESSAEVDNIFTALIPIGSKSGKNLFIDDYQTMIHGHNKHILVNQIVDVFTDEELNTGYHTKRDYQMAVVKYGMIYKVEKFPNADTKEKLWEYATDWIKNNYIGGLTSFDITALDMHHTDWTIPKYLIGQKVRVIYPDLDSRADDITPMIEKTLTITSITYHLHEPQKNEYSIGIPNSILNKTYGTAKSGGGGGGGGIAAIDEQHLDEEKALEAFKEEVDEILWAFIIDKKRSSEEYAKLMEDYGVDRGVRVLTTAYQVLSHVQEESYFGEQQRKVYDMILSGPERKLTFTQGDGPIDPSFYGQWDPFQDALKSIVVDWPKGTVSFKQMYLGQSIDTSEKLIQAVDGKTVAEIESLPTGIGAVLTAWKDGHFKESLEAIKSLTIDGSDGVMGAIMTKLGKDGSGEMPTIIQDGIDSMLSMFKTDLITGQPEEDPNIVFDGQAGEGKLGVYNTGTQEKDWRIKLNDTVKYVDVDGVEHTLSGFVSARDFNVPEIPSFKTKLAAIDKLFAGAIYTDTLEAALADIDILQVQGLVVTGGISCGGRFSCDTLTATTINGLTVSELASMLTGFSASNSEGRITLQWSDGGGNHSFSFTLDEGGGESPGYPHSMAEMVLTRDNPLVHTYDAYVLMDNDDEYLVPLRIDATDIYEAGQDSILENPETELAKIVLSAGDTGMNVKKTVKLTINGEFEHDIDAYVDASAVYQAGKDFIGVPDSIESVTLTDDDAEHYSNIPKNVIVYMDNDTEYSDVLIRIDASAIYRAGRNSVSPSEPSEPHSIESVTLTDSDANTYSNILKQVIVYMDNDDEFPGIPLRIDASKVYEKGWIDGYCAAADKVRVVNAPYVTVPVATYQYNNEQTANRRVSLDITTNSSIYWIRDHVAQHLFTVTAYFGDTYIARKDGSQTNSLPK